MERLVLDQTENGCTRLTFNRPAARNAMSPEMMEELYEALMRAETDPAVRCIVLTGAGGNFLGGGDIKAWARLLDLGPEERAEDFRRRVSPVSKVYLLLDRMSKPVIAAVQGAVAGAGLSLVLAADIVIADATAYFIFANVRAGLSLDAGMTFYMPRIIGERNAKYLSLLGERIDVHQARDVGMVTIATESSDFDQQVDKVVARLVAGPARAMAETRALLHCSRGAKLEQQLEAEVEAVARCAADDNFLEAVTAFSERRTPTFK